MMQFPQLPHFTRDVRSLIKQYLVPFDEVDQIMYHTSLYIQMVQFIQNLPLEGEISFMTVFPYPEYIATQDWDHPSLPYHHLYSKMKSCEQNGIGIIGYLMRSGFRSFDLYNLYQKTEKLTMKCHPQHIEYAHQIFYRAIWDLNLIELRQFFGKMEHFRLTNDLLVGYYINAKYEMKRAFIQTMLARLRGDKHVRVARE